MANVLCWLGLHRWGEKVESVAFRKWVDFRMRLEGFCPPKISFSEAICPPVRPRQFEYKCSRCGKVKK